MCRLETENFVFFFSSQFIFLECADWPNQRDFSRFTCAKNMSNQISRIRVTVNKLRNKSKLFFFNALLFFSAGLFLVN